MTVALLALGAVTLFVAGLFVRARLRLAEVSDLLRVCRRELEQLQYTFGRFSPPELVERLIEEGAHLEASRREVTVLFADIRDFTHISESMDPARLVKLLNGYFSIMCGAIANHQGVVGKFIGDGLMATFGALRPNPWQASDAVRAGLSMLRELDGYNDALAKDGGPTLRIGIGIHGGEVIAGIVGGDRVAEYTVLGDTVNVASRVESLTKTLGVPLLVTEAVVENLDEQFETSPMRPAEVKGKHEPIRTYGVRLRQGGA